MSFGSRAISGKPEALVILFRAITFETAFFADEHRSVFVRSILSAPRQVLRVSAVLKRRKPF
jgi:hypothetical protein